MDIKNTSVSDILGICALLTMFVSGITWGLKLEFMSMEQEDRLQKIEQQLYKGILPLAEEKIIQLERRVQKLENVNNTHKII